MFSHLEYRDWENACELLKYQISRKAENRHFNTLSMHSYQHQSIDKLKTETYFEGHVKNGLVLFCEDVLYSRHFPAPKGTIRYRHWSFLSLQMRLLYYALGLHVARKLSGIPVANKVDSRYGANIQHFHKDGRIILEKSYVYYKKHYQGFYKAALSKVKELEAAQDFTELCVVKMDLENFFEQIDLSQLLSLPYLKPSKFPVVPIRLFFSLMTRAPKGLPQTCNDPVAGYLSWLYLKQFDLVLAEFLEHQETTSDFHVYRYCDDTHVFMYFPNKTETTAMQTQVASLIEHCKGFLWSEYGLRLNSKTVYYHLNDEKQREAYKESLKSTSMGEEFYIDEDVETYHFDETYRAFIQNVALYLDHDLMKGDVESSIKENMKRIYHGRFQEDLGSILAQDPAMDLSTELAVHKAQILGLLNKLDSAHLLHEPRVFSFFKKYYPEKFKSLLLEGQPDTKIPSVSYQWAICGFGMDDTYEQGENKPYFDRLKQLPLYGIQESETETEHAVAIQKIADFLQENIDSHDMNKFEYLSYFTCQRRAAELSGDFNSALNYLNSECCILLSLLGWDLGPKSRPKNYAFHFSLNNYRHIGSETTPALHALERERNKTDISHNKTAVPEGLTRMVSKDEYSDIKAQVFQEIAAHQENLSQAESNSPRILPDVAQTKSTAFVKANTLSSEAG